ncbi:DUF1800 domain-containing protein [Pedobacter africanus]|uniref:DUF1800 domain-containing protein n=1 Tax=Pedobacter africanus TaxID=151894 RepID=A0A1W2B6C0_9SPHI|nr:DUF1800 domain-containing protein [Pedobacter africanus]SMC68545.1 Protein of unknown function [Pedobacter africanus]
MDRKDNFINIKHLYNRGGFGIAYSDLHKLSRKSIEKVVNELLEIPKESADLATVDPDEVRRQMQRQSELGAKKELTEAEKNERQEITRIQNEQSRKLNLDWMQRLIGTEQPLLEKMTLFWHGHFACRSNNPMFAQQLNNIQRKYALGSFKTLLVEVSKSPAMLQYLNNQQNRKGRPNENFARELMELFTIGRGNYTEKDVKESARAFTGWTYNKEGAFEFKKALHDDQIKVFFGNTGNFDGEAIIDQILDKPATSVFICTKLYQFFVNETPNEAHIKELSNYFYRQKYNISDLMRKMFSSAWFYDKENIGTKIKSPVEFLVGLSREFHVTYNKPQVLIQLQSNLGQYLFNPPNVAGWPGGKNWIDSSSLMLRMKIPSLVLNDGLIDFSGKADPEDEAVIAQGKKSNIKPIKSAIDAKADWPKFLEGLPKKISPVELATFLLQPAVSAKVTGMIQNNLSLKNTAIEITSMPEYQLC